MIGNRYLFTTYTNVHHLKVENCHLNLDICLMFSGHINGFKWGIDFNYKPLFMISLNLLVELSQFTVRDEL